MLGQVQDIDIKLLRVFLCIVECGGFARAQARLNMTPSAISTQMAHLEARLGGRLCERGHGEFYLTEHGEVVLEAAEQLLASLDDFRSKVVETQNELVGDLRIGIIDNSINNPQCRLMDAIHSFSERAPQATPKIRVCDPVELETMVTDGRLHLAIGPFPHGLSNLAYQPLFHEEQVLYCGSRHPLYDKKKPTIEDIESAKYVGWAESEFLIRDGGRLSLKQSASSPHIEGVASLILSGHYVGFQPVHYADYWVKQGLMKPLLPEYSGRKFQVHLITRKTGYLPQVAQRFVEELLNHSPE